MSERRHGSYDFLGASGRFSKGLLARALGTVGVPDEPAYDLALRLSLIHI